MSERRIFVFGSNQAGRHGRGAAKAAVREHGAKYGVGEGLTGNAYALPTKDVAIRTLPLENLRRHVDLFIRFAKEHPELTFDVTAVGCGLAGYKLAQIAYMFTPAVYLENVYLPREFVDYIGNDRVSFERL